MRTFILLGAALLLGSQFLPAQQLRLKETHRFSFSRGAVSSLTFSPDERLLACGGKAGDVAIYEIVTKKKIAELGISHDPVRSCTFFSDGKRLAVQTHDISIWSVPEGRLLQRWPADLSSIESSALQISPDGEWMAYRHRMDVVVRSARDYRVVAQTAQFDAPLHAMRFLPSGERLLLEGLLIWHWKQPKSKLVPAQRKEAPRGGASQGWPEVPRLSQPKVFADRMQLDQQSVAVPPGSRLHSTEAGGSLIVVQAPNAGYLLFDRNLTPIGSMPFLAESEALVLGFGRSGQTMAIGSVRGPVRVWRKGLGSFDLPGTRALASSVALDSTRRWLAICAAHRVTAIELETGERRDLGAGHAVSHGWRKAEFLIASSLRVRSVKADTQKSRIFAPLKTPSLRDGNLQSMASSRREGQVLYASGRGGILGPSSIRSLTKGGGDRVVEGGNHLTDVSWSRDGQYRIMVSDFASICGTSSSIPNLRLTGPPHSRPWIQEARTAARGLSYPWTADLSPCLERVTWGGRDGAVTYSRNGNGPAKIHRNKDACLLWLRYLDDDHFLAHDGQTLSLWRAKDLHRLASVDPYRIPRALQRGKFEDHPQEPVFVDGDPTPIFIRDALLSNDGKRIILVGVRDVRVYDVRIR